MEQYIEPLRRMAGAITWEGVVRIAEAAGPVYCGAVLALPVATLVVILLMLSWARARRVALRRLAYREITRNEKRRR